jgi:hypothetical protein
MQASEVVYGQQGSAILPQDTGPQGVQLVEKPDEVQEGAPKAIYGPRHDHIEFPPCGILQEPVKG